jgi:hypothetical protein
MEYRYAENRAINTKIAYLYVSDGLVDSIRRCPGSGSRSRHGFAPRGRKSAIAGAPLAEIPQLGLAV